jgi:hypothetical protein
MIIQFAQGNTNGAPSRDRGENFGDNLHRRSAQRSEPRFLDVDEIRARLNRFGGLRSTPHAD